MLIVLTLVNDELLYAGLTQAVAQRSSTFRLCALRGATSIASGYNTLVATSQSAAADVLCFIHQDARFLFDAAAIVPRYLACLPRAGVLGFCGSTAQQAGRQWHACPPCVGGLLQGRGPVEPLFFAPPTADIGGLRYAMVQTLDGYCLFVSRQVFDHIGGFDEEYRGWHGYDIDLCMRALRCGYQNYVIAQPSQHYSRGRANEDLAESLELFHRKWADFLACAPAAISALVARDEEEQLGRLLRACAEPSAQPGAWVALSEYCRKQGEHAGSYWAAQRALAMSARVAKNRNDSLHSGLRLYDLVSAAAWNLGLSEEARDHSLRALECNPYDDQLARNYRRIQELSAPEALADGPPLVDVVILCCARTRREYEMTKSCIRSLRLSSPRVPAHVVVVETNANLRAEPFVEDIEPFGPSVDIVYPGGKFSYNAFLRAGYDACAQSPARYFMVLNNDVTLFAHGFLEQMVLGLGSMDSVSPLGLREAQWGLVDRTVAVDINYDINRAVCGWCLMFDKKILASAPFETYFPSEFIWYGQDEHYAETLRAFGYRHGLVTAARALHLQRSSHHLLGETLAAPANRKEMLRDLGIRHKRCVAVGSGIGDYIGEILACEPAILMLVEPWGHAGQELCSRPSAEVSSRSDKLHIVAEHSGVAAKAVDDQSLDFVYIDAALTPETVGADARAWWPKLKQGGWLAGRNYQLSTVQEAVTAFCRETGATLAFATRDDPPSWAIQVLR